jgi:TusE/DsrC/DsvC family sulfur relay protein
MADINKYIGDNASTYSETQDHMMDLEPWNEEIGAETARGEGIEMTDAHWKVVRFLRDHYVAHGMTSARKLTDLLDDAFAAQGGRKYLYEIFPEGPVTQGTKIAGLPVPKDSTDPSFGSVR